MDSNDLTQICIPAVCRPFELVQVWLGLISATAAFAAVAIAWLQLGRVRHDNARREAIRLIDLEATDSQRQALRSKFLQVIDSVNRDPTAVAGFYTHQDKIVILRQILNQTELTAVVSETGAADRKVILSMWRRMIIDDWRCLYGLVQVIRADKKEPRLFGAFERLARTAEKSTPPSPPP